MLFSTTYLCENAFSTFSLKWRQISGINKVFNQTWLILTSIELVKNKVANGEGIFQEIYQYLLIEKIIILFNSWPEEEATLRINKPTLCLSDTNQAITCKLLHTMLLAYLSEPIVHKSVCQKILNCYNIPSKNIYNILHFTNIIIIFALLHLWMGNPITEGNLSTILVI